MIVMSIRFDAELPGYTPPHSPFPRATFFLQLVTYLPRTASGRSGSEKKKNKMDCRLRFSFSLPDSHAYSLWLAS